LLFLPTALPCFRRIAKKEEGESESMDFGVDYYPEHWDESRWETDIQMMQRLNFNIIRIAEFAWSRLEPTEGNYDFSWIDRIIDISEKYGMKIMMGVPVRNVPAWLLKKDPTIAIQAFEGHLESFGSRYTTCIHHPALQTQALKLSEEMALRYRTCDTVTSWHLDNEYGDASLCYCDLCRQAFIGWLQEKHQTVDNLNKAWGLVFWSLEIQDWDEIWVPTKINHFPHNPGLLQDYRRFSSWKTEMFVKKQADLFRMLAPNQLITTNLQSMTRDHTDYHLLSQHIDVVSTNYYPPLSYTAADLDLMRCLKNRNFWVVEQKSGTPGFAHNGFLNPAPGETRLFTYQSLAHGADAILYFRWRVCNYGQEQLHKGILDYDGSTNRIFHEIEKVGSEIHSVWDEIQETTVKSDVALLMSYDTRWALQYFYPHPDIHFRDYFLQYYKTLQSLHVNVDIKHPKEDLSSYKVVIVPLLYMMDQHIADKLAKYVENGGTLIYSFRSGAKDENSNIVRTILPHSIRAVLGIEIEESMALAPNVTNEIETKDGTRYAVSKWVDLVKPNTATVLSRYASDWYQQSAAVTANEYGEGKAYYIGTMTEEAFIRDFLVDVMDDVGIQPILDVPENIEVVSRTNETNTYIFVLNPTGSTCEMTVSKNYKDMVSKRELVGRIELEPYGVLVLKELMH
jgi:beta-galactosidase